MKKLTIPKFATEKEEAEWWDAHRAEVGDTVIEAMKNGTAEILTKKRLRERIKHYATKNITINMPLTELERARKLSRKKGLGYQTYMKMLLREALDREEAAVRRGHRQKTA